MTHQTDRTATVVRPDAVAYLEGAVVGPLNFDDWVSLLATLQDIQMPRLSAHCERTEVPK